MGAFEFTALDNEGKTRRGIIESESLYQARQQLRDKHWSPLSVASTKPGKEKTTKVLRSPSLSIKELALITRQLATLIESGLTVEEALKAVSEQTGKKATVTLTLMVRAKILEGFSLADSLENFPRTFSRLYVSTVRAGEKAGFLGPVLDQLADYTEARYESAQKIKLALLYPVILLIFSILIVSGLLAFVVPKVVTVFIDTGQSLPALTKGLIAAGNFISAYGIFILVLIILSIIVFQLLLRDEAVRLRFDHFKLTLPLYEKLEYGLDTARFASTLSILSSSGVALVEAMQIATEVIKNSCIRKRVKHATTSVVEGNSLYSSLAQTECFPPMMLYMIASGEKSGSLDRMLDKTSRNQEKELENFITVVVRLFEPAMLIVMGGIVLLIVLAILLPILNLNQLVN